MSELLDTYFPGPRILSADEVSYEIVVKKNDNGDPLEKESKLILPTFLNPFYLQSAALMVGSFNIGSAVHLLSSPVTFYLVQTLDISATQLTAYHALKSIPWSLKFLWGMVSL